MDEFQISKYKPVCLFDQRPGEPVLRCHNDPPLHVWGDRPPEELTLVVGGGDAVDEVLAALLWVFYVKKMCGKRMFFCGKRPSFF